MMTQDNWELLAERMHFQLPIQLFEPVIIKTSLFLLYMYYFRAGFLKLSTIDIGAG